MRMVPWGETWRLDSCRVAPPPFRRRQGFTSLQWAIAIAIPISGTETSIRWREDGRTATRNVPLRERRNDGCTRNLSASPLCWMNRVTIAQSKGQIPTGGASPVCRGAITLGSRSSSENSRDHFRSTKSQSTGEKKHYNICIFMYLLLIYMYAYALPYKITLGHLHLTKSQSTGENK